MHYSGLAPARSSSHRSTTSSGWQGLVNLAVAFAVISALTVVGAGRFAIAFILAFVAAFDGTGARAVVAAFFIAAGFAAAIPIAAAGTAVVAVAVVVCTNVAIRSIQDMMARRGLKGLFYIIFLPVMLGLLAVAISNASWFPPEYGFVHFIFVFLVLLPLTNSIFDWLSLAATRGLLKRMAQRDDTPPLQVAGNALVGLFLGVLLLAGLAVAATAGLQTMNHLSQGHGGPEFFDLSGTLHRLRTNPAEPAVWWVYFTLFSTMLPTVFHATIASASFVTWRLPDSWKRHWLDLIGTGDIKDDHRVLVSMAWRLTLIDVATVLLAALSAAILAWLLFWLMPHEGRGLLWLCERVAEWLGAPIQI